jgi:hypothetical protein
MNISFSSSDLLQVQGPNPLPTTASIALNFGSKKTFPSTAIRENALSASVYFDVTNARA